MKNVYLIPVMMVCLLFGTQYPAGAEDQKKLVPQSGIIDDGTRKLPGEANSTTLQSGASSTTLQEGANSTQLQGGTAGALLQGKTDSTLLEGKLQLNNLTIQDWRSMDLKGFTTQAKLMPAIPATVRFVASNAKLDENILKATATRLESTAVTKPDESNRMMIHLVRCPPADPGMKRMWDNFEREMRNEYRSELWRAWEEQLQQAAQDYWEKNSKGTGVISYHVVIDEGLNIEEISERGHNPFADKDLEDSIRKTLDSLKKVGNRFPSGSGVDKVHLSITFMRRVP